MSYILDALRKAERERGIAQVPTLATVHEIRAESRMRPWAISGVFVAGITLILWFVLPYLRTSQKPLPSPAHERGRVESVSETERIEKTTPAGPTPSSLQPSETSAPAQTMAVAPGAAAPKPAASERRLSQPSTQTAAANPPASQPKSAPLDNEELPKTQPVAGKGSPGELSSAGTQQKPAALREAITRMNMSILSFSESQSERLVFINGKKYVEGDYVEGLYLLQSITPEGAVLSFEGERAILRPGAK